MDPPHSPDSVQPEPVPPPPTPPLISPSAQPLMQKLRRRKKDLRNLSKVNAALNESNFMHEKALEKAENYPGGMFDY